MRVMFEPVNSGGNKSGCGTLLETLVTMPKPKWKLEAVLEFLNAMNLIPAASDPARIEFDGPQHFKCYTPRSSKVRRTTSFAVGSIGARNAGMNDRLSFY
jgi:hypothetical protein